MTHNGTPDFHKKPQKQTTGASTIDGASYYYTELETTILCWTGHCPTGMHGLKGCPVHLPTDGQYRFQHCCHCDRYLFSIQFSSFMVSSSLLLDLCG